MSWSKASETNNIYFSIERSSNAIEWQVLQEIKSAGNSSIRCDYLFTDTNPLAEFSYYILNKPTMMVNLSIQL